MRCLYCNRELIGMISCNCEKSLNGKKLWSKRRGKAKGEKN